MQSYCKSNLWRSIPSCGVAPQHHRVKVDAAGRIVLPADVRQRHGLHQGDEVVVEEGAAGLRLLTVAQAVANAQALFARRVPVGVSLSEELLRERREEAARE